MASAELVRALVKRQRKIAKQSDIKAGKAPKEPTAIEQRLAMLGRKVSSRMHAEAMKLLDPVLERAEARSTREDARDEFEGEDLKEIRRILARIKRRAASLFSEIGVAAELSNIAKQLDLWNREDVARYLGIDVDKVAPSPEELTRFRRAAAGLIKDLTSTQADRIADLVTEAQTGGLRVETLRKRLVEEEGVASRRAELIARDQVLKANGELNKQRQQAAGVERYIWSAGADDRVRPMHRDLDGKTFRWDDPPVTNPQGDRNHPGQDYQCRCGAIPLMPGDEEADDITRRAMAAIRGVA